MPGLSIAANLVSGTEFLGGYGHLQIVFTPDVGDPLELEVQGPSNLFSGPWVFESRTHNTTAHTGFYGDPDKYAIYQIMSGQEAEDAWTILNQVHAQMVAASNGGNIYEYDPDYNSNTYTVTMLSVIGINASDYYGLVTPNDVGAGFIGDARNAFRDAGYLNDAINLTVYGTANADTIILGNGSDTVFGGGGNDTIGGDAGSQTATNGAADFLFGGDGLDTIFGNNGADWLYGGDDNDTLNGGAGADLMFGEAGSDIMNGGDDGDYMWGGSESDTMHGNDGVDWLRGEEGIDYLYGDAGDDVLIGGSGDDQMWGGTDTDTFYGEDDNDWIYGEANGDVAFGQLGNDHIYGGSEGDFLFGGAGADVINGGTENDLMWGAMPGMYDGFADTFEFDANWGFDAVYDFELGVDQVRFNSVAGLMQFSNLTLIDGGANVTAVFGADAITFYGVTQAELEAVQSDFSFT